MNGQRGITNFLTAMVFICVPLMLCVKPCVLGCCHKKKEGHGGDFERIDAGQGESHNEEADARERLNQQNNQNAGKDDVQ